MENDQPPSTNPIVFTLTVPWSDVQKTYEQRLEELVSSTTLPGFRPGKTPKKLVEEKVGKKSILGDVIERVVPQAYQRQMAQQNITPLISPRLKPLVLEEGKDWQFEVAVVVRPSIELGDYEQKVTDALAAGKIIVPGKQDGQTPQQKMSKVFDVLLSLVKVDLPGLLVEEEVNTRLGQLVDQLQAVGMTVDQYLQSKRLTIQQLRASYEKTAREMLTLNLTLDEIAREKNFTGKDRISRVVDWLITH